MALPIIHSFSPWYAINTIPTCLKSWTNRYGTELYGMFLIENELRLAMYDIEHEYIDGSPRYKGVFHKQDFEPQEIEMRDWSSISFPEEIEQRIQPQFKLYREQRRQRQQAFLEEVLDLIQPRKRPIQYRPDDDCIFLDLETNEETSFDLFHSNLYCVHEIELKYSMIYVKLSSIQLNTLSQIRIKGIV